VGKSENAKGLKPTNCRILADLRTRAVILSQEAIATVKEIRHELGWK
jgi:hypothetical protein